MEQDEEDEIVFVDLDESDSPAAAVVGAKRKAEESLSDEEEGGGGMIDLTMDETDDTIEGEGEEGDGRGEELGEASSVGQGLDSGANGDSKVAPSDDADSGAAVQSVTVDELTELMPAKRRRKKPRSSEGVGEADDLEGSEGPPTNGSSVSCSSLELPEEELNLLNEDECAICEAEGELLCCDGPCLQSFHLSCKGLDDATLPEGKWYCSPECQRGEMPPLPALTEEETRSDPQRAEKMRIRRLRMTIHRQALSKWHGENLTLETRAALRGIDYLYRIALNKRNFANFGSDILSVLYDLSSCTTGVIRQAALERTEILAKHWKTRFRSLVDIAREVAKHKPEGEDEAAPEEAPEPSKDDVNTAIRGVYVLMRMGLWTPLAAETRNFVKSGHFSVQDFLDFDPKKKPNPLPRKRPQFALANAIDTAFHADRIGVNVGASALEVISLLPRFRPYQNSDELGWKEWEDQTDMVINLIHVCSNNGELRLEPTLFPDEAAFFQDPDILRWPIELDDVHLVGEICHCLKVLGASPDDPLLHTGRDFILQHQEDDGSWPVRDKTEDPWDKFLATAAGVVGIVPLCPRAYGPGDAALADTLRRVNTATTPALPPALAKAATEPPKPKVAPPSVIMCGSTRPVPMRRFRTLQTTYERSSGTPIEQNKAGDFTIGGVPLDCMTDYSLKGRAQQRFQELLAYKRKHAPSGKTKTRVHANWFRAQDKKWVASYIKKAAATLDRNKFAKALKEHAPGKEPELRPVSGTARTDLFPLYQLVAGKGGQAMITSTDEWTTIARKPTVNAAQGLADRGRRAKELYDRYLGDFEIWFAEEYYHTLQREEVERILNARIAEHDDRVRLAKQALMAPPVPEGGEDSDAEVGGTEPVAALDGDQSDGGVSLVDASADAPMEVAEASAEDGKAETGGGEDEQSGNKQDDVNDLTLEEGNGGDTMQVES